MPYTIEIDGVIGIDVWPSMISRELRNAAGEDVEILFSSPGGYIDDGLAIFNLINDYEGKTTAKIIGMAASMASYIPLAANKVIAKSNAVYMIHDALTALYGNEAEHIDVASLLGRYSNLLAEIFAKKTGKSKEEIRALMRAETYFFGSEMLEAGFVDEIEEAGGNIGNKADIVLDAKSKVENTVLELKDIEKRKVENNNKVAAMLKPKNEVEPNGAKPEPKQEPDNSAQAHNNETEVNMTLDEFLAQNPEAKAQYDERLKNAKTEGAAEINRIVARSSVVFESEVYAKNPKLVNLAVKALKGEVSADAVDIALSVIDIETESNNSAAADTETPDETPAGETQALNPDKPKNVEDMQEMIAGMKGKKKGGE